jgi:hypothetical protein
MFWKKNIKILNVTRIQVAENRKALNELMPSLRLTIKTFYGGFLKSLILESNFLEWFLL